MIAAIVWAFAIGICSGLGIAAIIYKRESKFSDAQLKLHVEAMRRACQQSPLSIVNNLQFPDGTTLIIESGTPVNRLQ